MTNGKPSAARRNLGERLQQVDVPAGRLLRRVLQRLAGLVDDEQQARAGLVAYRLDRFLEAPDDVGRRATGERRGRAVQQPLDGSQHPRLRTPLGRPNVFDRGTQGLQEEGVQGSTLGRQQRGQQRLLRRREPVRPLEETPGCVPARIAAARQQVCQEDGERALAGPVGAYQAPRPVAGLVIEPVGDLREGAADRRRDDVAVEGIRRPRVAVEVDRAPEAALDLDEAREIGRFLVGVHRHAASTDHES